MHIFNVHARRSRYVSRRNLGSECEKSTIKIAGRLRHRLRVDAYQLSGAKWKCAKLVGKQELADEPRYLNVNSKRTKGDFQAVVGGKPYAGCDCFAKMHG